MTFKNLVYSNGLRVRIISELPDNGRLIRFRRERFIIEFCNEIHECLDIGSAKEVVSKLMDKFASKEMEEERNKKAIDKLVDEWTKETKDIVGEARFESPDTCDEQQEE